MRLLKISNSCFLFLWVTLFSLNASAQLIGVDDNKMNNIMRGLKKINSRLMPLKTEEIKNLQHQLEDLLRQIEEVKQTIPQLQGAVELNKSQTLSQINKVDSKLVDLDAELKNEVLVKINQQNQALDNFKNEQKITLKNLKDKLTQDMEQFDTKSIDNFKNFASVNKSALEKVVQRLEALENTTRKSFDDTKDTLISSVIPAIAQDNKNNKTIILQNISRLSQANEKALEFSKKQNQKLVEIFGENIKRIENTRVKLEAVDKNLTAKVDAINKNLTSVKDNTNVNNNNQKVADEKMNKLAAAIKELQINNTASSQALDVLKGNLVNVKAFEKLTDSKINKLIENSSQLTLQANHLEESVIKELTESSRKENSNQDKIDLANEKLSRLIEILKFIAAEQDKLGQVIKVQGELNKAQAGLVKNQESIKKALADLRRKANVSIQGGNDIKKTLSTMNKK